MASQLSAAVVGGAAAAAAIYYYLEQKKATGFLKAVGAATSALGKENILEPADAKALLDGTADALLLDV